MRSETGPVELRRAIGQCRGHFWAVGLFSVFVNLLMLTGPMFMLTTYDTILPSRSVESLVALVILATFLFLMMGLLEYARGRMLARAGARFQELLDNRVFTAVLRRSVSPGERAKPNTASRNLDAVRQLLSGPAPFAVFDIPWTPLFLAAIFLFHPYMGWLAVAGGLLLITLTFVNQFRSRRLTIESNVASGQADNMAEAMRQNAEAVQGLGMRKAVFAEWQKARRTALAGNVGASDRTGSYSSATKALRFYLQSMMLGLGAWLALQMEISPGMMIAGSILMGRALAPIEQAIGQWSLAQRAAAGWRDLGKFLQDLPEEGPKTQLPAPKGYLEVQGAAVRAPGEQTIALRDITFAIGPGKALGVIGPSGAGKSTLAKVLVGIWPLVAGKVRLDGAALDQWPIDDLGRHFGYLPQEIGLFSGTVARNIARMSAEPDDEKVVEAAKRAGAHELLLTLPQGYDTDIGYGGQRLSGGQRQRVALARALYGDPPVLVLDEPNANLDAPGEQAVITAIREAKTRGKTVIVIAHRPSAVAACDYLLMLDKGRQVDFGPRDEVLKKRTRNYPQLVGGRQAQAAQAQQQAPQASGEVGRQPSPTTATAVAPAPVLPKGVTAAPTPKAEPAVEDSEAEPLKLGEDMRVTPVTAGGS